MELINLETVATEENERIPTQNAEPEHNLIKEPTRIKTNKAGHKRSPTFLENLRDRVFRRSQPDVIYTFEESENTGRNKFEEHLNAERKPVKNFISLFGYEKEGGFSPGSEQISPGIEQISIPESSQEFPNLDSISPYTAKSHDPVLKESHERARKNWKKIKLVLNAIKFINKLNERIEEKEIKIMRGRKKKTTVINSRNNACKSQIPWFAIHPKSRCKYFWDFFMAIAILYFQAVMPYRVAFLIFTPAWFFLDLVLDGIFLLDLISHLLVAHEVQGEIIYSFKTAPLRYLKTFFIFDLVTLLPFELVMPSLVFVKVLRLYRIGDVTKVAERIINQIILIIYRGKINFKAYNKLFTAYRLGFWFTLLAHLFACMWIAVAQSDRLSDLESGSKTWSKNWLEQLPRGTSNFSTYLIGLYYVVTTMTTVGFGDYTATTVNEYLFACFLEYWGVINMAYFQSNMIYLASKFMQTNVDLNKEEHEIDLWLFKQESACINRLTDVKFDVSEEIKNYYLFHTINNVEPQINQHRFLLQLPSPIRIKLETLIFAKTIQTFRAFFDNVDDPTFISGLLTKLRPEAYVRDQVLICEGHPTHRIIFILVGAVNVCKNSKPIAKLPASSYIGDEMLCFQKANFDFIVASPTLECLTINKKEFTKLCHQAPMIRERLIQMAWARASHFQSEYHNSDWKLANRSPRLKAFKQPVQEMIYKNDLIKNLLFPIQEEPEPEKNVVNNGEEEGKINIVDYNTGSFGLNRHRVAGLENFVKEKIATIQAQTLESEILTSEITEQKSTENDEEFYASPGLKIKKSLKKKKRASNIEGEILTKDSQWEPKSEQKAIGVGVDVSKPTDEVPQREIIKEELLSDIKIELTQDCITHPMNPLGYAEFFKEARKRVEQHQLVPIKPVKKGVYDSENEEEEASAPANEINNFENYSRKNDTEELDSTKNDDDDDDDDLLNRSIEEPIERHIPLLLDLPHTSNHEIIEHLQEKLTNLMYKYARIKKTITDESLSLIKKLKTLKRINQKKSTLLLMDSNLANHL